MRSTAPRRPRSVLTTESDSSSPPTFAIAAHQRKGTCMDEYMSRRGVWYLTCRNSPEEIGRARRWTRDMLQGQPIADDAELIVSELSTNALLHSASGCQQGTF